MPGLDRRQVLARATLAGATLAVAAAGAPRARAAGRHRIEIHGNRFVYAGRPLRLTGVAVGDPLYIRGDRPLSDYRTIAGDWRANCVRISVMPGLWRSERAASRTSLALEIATARALGLFVILDWHRIGFPGYYDPLVPEDWGVPTDLHLASFEETAAFWREMARTYGDDPAILFELWNEPVADERLWQATGEHWPLFKAAWEPLVAEIRGLADNIVLCAGGYWAHDLVGVAADPVADPRTAYVWHVYPNAERGDMQARKAALGGLETVKPVVVTEWGFCRDCAIEIRGGIDDFAEPFADDILDTYGLSHTAWCYSPGAMPNLLASRDGTPSLSGTFVRDLLRRSSARPEWTTSD